MSIKIFKSSNIRGVLTAILTFSIFYSCQNDDENFNNNGAIYPVHFTSEIGKNGIQTRASNASWDNGDLVGIFMKSSGGTLSDQTIIDNRSNVTYITPLGNGSFTPETSGQTIYYPQDNSAVDFIAYYPYQANINNYIYKIDIQNQTKPENIDILYSNNIKGVSLNSPGSALKFGHQLSKIKLNINAGTNITSLNNLKVSIDGIKTLANFSLVDGTITVDQNSEVGLNLKTTINSTTALAEAILIPDDGGTNRIIKIALSSTVTFKWEIPSATKLQKGYQYTFNITLNSDGVIVIPDNGWIETPMMDNLATNQVYIKNMMPGDSKIRNYSMLYDTQYKLAY